ncbi:tyrosine phosphatase family protein [Rhizobium sp. L1K21]|uniref:tyrosine phosphatase family protein n=1 Tax=Rhizobium sp. L1K21 TaxID=2954933 RepID=UPI0020927825|nr:tyrosine phosphatase family protein [Rhizobium sp. L1K21]MCO6186578.1 tyrosine phosphatase family protein [Rhizobium sp. L1K21]
MPVIAVSSLSMIAETAVRLKSREMISLLSEGQHFHRPAVISAARHLLLGVNDISDEQDGLIAPQELHVRKIIDFAREWDQGSPLLVHCWFGVSRSPAAALIAALAVKPELDDLDLAQVLRKASPQASPNTRLIAIGDQLLGRGGKLIQAAQAINRGVEYEGEKPFSFTF